MAGTGQETGRKRVSERGAPGHSFVILDGVEMNETVYVQQDPVKCKIVSRKNNLYLVEFMGDYSLERRFIVSDMIIEDNGQFAIVDNPNAGIPYGMEWEELVSLGATPELIATELRRHGIWTYEDLINDPNGALGAIQAAYRFDLARLLRAAKDATANS